jgi:hypothetical protein
MKSFLRNWRGAIQNQQTDKSKRSKRRAKVYIARDTSCLNQKTNKSLETDLIKSGFGRNFASET